MRSKDYIKTKKREKEEQVKNRELEEKEEEIHEMATVSHERKQKEEKRKRATEITPITYTGKSEFIIYIKKTFAERKEGTLPPVHGKT